MNKIIQDEIILGEDASGRDLTAPIYRVSGKPNDKMGAPSVYIQASIHGAEVQGNLVIHHLLKRLSSLKVLGDITLIPMANPIGTNHKSGENTQGRFDPVTGENWNRQYHFDNDDLSTFINDWRGNSETSIKKAFRQRLANQITTQLNDPWGLSTGQNITLKLQQEALQADIVLDLHTGPVSARHLYTNKKSLTSACLFGIPITIVIPDQFDGALDEAISVPWRDLEKGLKEQGQSINFGIEAFTIELGSENVIIMEEAIKDAEAILDYLDHKGVLKLDRQPLVQKSITPTPLNNLKTLYSPHGGLVEYFAKQGEKVKAGETLAKIYRPREMGRPEAVHLITIPHDVTIVLHNTSSNILSGTELFKVIVSL